MADHLRGLRHCGRCLSCAYPQDMGSVIQYAEEWQSDDGRASIIGMYLLAGRCSAKLLDWTDS